MEVKAAVDPDPRLQAGLEDEAPGDPLVRRRLHVGAEPAPFRQPEFPGGVDPVGRQALDARHQVGVAVAGDILAGAGLQVPPGIEGVDPGQLKLRGVGLGAHAQARPVDVAARPGRGLDPPVAARRAGAALGQVQPDAAQPLPAILPVERLLRRRHVAARAARAGPVARVILGRRRERQGQHREGAEAGSGKPHDPVPGRTETRRNMPACMCIIM